MSAPTPPGLTWHRSAARPNRWTMKRLWQYSRPSRSCCIRHLTSDGENGAAMLSSKVARSCSQYSMTIKMLVSSWPTATSWTRTMLMCRSAAGPHDQKYPRNARCVERPATLRVGTKRRGRTLQQSDFAEAAERQARRLLLQPDLLQRHHVARAAVPSAVCIPQPPRRPGRVSWRLRRTR
mgnify:CR=1 FL=1